MKTRVKQNILYASLWIGCSVLVYQYIHHYAAIIPCWFFAGNMLQYRMGSKYIQKLVNNIELTPQKDIVKLRLSNGQIITAKIEDIDFIDIIELTEKGPLPLSGRSSSQIKSNSFVTVFDVCDVNKREFKDLRVLVEQKKVEIENLDLFKYILMGETEEVQKYNFVEDINAKQKKEDQELEKKLEDEIYQNIQKDAAEKEQKEQEEKAKIDANKNKEKESEGKNEEGKEQINTSNNKKK